MTFTIKYHSPFGIIIVLENKEENITMKKSGSTVIFGLAFCGLLFMAGCEKQLTHDTGFLEGVISIGPICPVESVPTRPECLPTADTYKAYPVNVYSSDGSKLIAHINPGLDGTFRTELVPGNYLVILDLNQNKAAGSNLPAEVSIVSSGETILNISIDTGIR